MSEKRGNTSQKSNAITGTPARSTAIEVTPNAKKSSEREQDSAKKSKHEGKKILLKLFGDEAPFPAPTNKETPINAVVQRRKSRGKGNNTPDKAEAEQGGKKEMT
jgi:hypothetical protein